MSRTYTSHVYVFHHINCDEDTQPMCTLLSPNIVFIRTYSSQTYFFSSLDIYVIIRCSSRHQNEDQCADAQASSHRSNKLPECQPSCVSPRNLVCTTCNPYQMMFCFFCHRKNWGVVTCAYSSLSRGSIRSNCHRSAFPRPRLQRSFPFNCPTN